VEDRGKPLRRHEDPNPDENHLITSNKCRRPIDNGSDTYRADLGSAALSFPILSYSVSTHGQSAKQSASMVFFTTMNEASC
jgi:hypothetical protein